MKEFVEKLIGRLEEKVVNRTFDESIKTKNLSYKEAIEIVNQLAEEYNNDFCEWKKNTTAFVKTPYYCTGCGNKRYGILGEGEYCPYCGKKIKVAPYQPKGE